MMLIEVVSPYFGVFSGFSGERYFKDTPETRQRWQNSSTSETKTVICWCVHVNLYAKDTNRYTRRFARISQAEF